MMRADAWARTRSWRRSSSMVGEAQRSRAPIQRLADVVASWFVPAVIAGRRSITFAVWAWLGPEPRLAHALVNAVAVLIIACPCALGLATPMSIMVGIGRGRQQPGVLVKNAEALELLEKVDTLVVDKTGTLTEGKPRLTGVRAGGRTSARSDLLRLAAAPGAGQRASAGARDRGRGAKARGIDACRPRRTSRCVTGEGVVAAASASVQVRAGQRGI